MKRKCVLDGEIANFEPANFKGKMLRQVNQR